MGSRVNLKMNIVLFLIRQNVSLRVLIFSNNVGSSEANTSYLICRGSELHQQQYDLEHRSPQLSTSCISGLVSFVSRFSYFISNRDRSGDRRRLRSSSRS